MFTSLPVFQNAGAMARHAAMRQAMVAQNMANSDTPGFQPSDIPDFAAFLNPHGQVDQLDRFAQSLVNSRTTDRSVDGVTIEEEMLRSVDAKRQHDRAMAIYRSSLGILRASIGRR